MADNQYEDIENLIDLPESRRERLQQDSSKLRNTFFQDRSRIAKAIIYLYCGVISIYGFYLLYRGLICKVDVSDQFLELFKIGILPIVTLVIGFYFGSKQSE